MRTSRVGAAALAGPALSAGAATAANAVASYHGADYPHDWNRSHNATTCDQEAHSTPVREVIAFNNPTISGHKTCEYRSFWPDARDDWQRY